MGVEDHEQQATRTPGDWETVVVEGNIRVRAGPNQHVCMVHNRTVPDSPMHDPDQGAWANARLIAAAPELLEAAKNIVGQGAQLEDYCDKAEHGPREDDKCIFCDLRYAIAKAEGEEVVGRSG